MKVGILGGAFDPPHMGHLLLGAYFLAREPKARLLIVPSLRHPFGKEMVSFALRVRWCKTLAKLLGPRAEVSTIEKEIAGTGRSLLVVQALAAQFPRASFSLVVGADAYRERHKWFEIDALEKAADFFVVGRGTIHDGDIVLPEISSHDIRARLARGESCEALVPALILEQISRVYGGGASPPPKRRTTRRHRAPKR